MSRPQLLEMGVHPQAIKHLTAMGRLYRVARGIYAVGRPTLGRKGWWMVAVLLCGPRAALSHTSAANLWRVGVFEEPSITVSVPGDVVRQPRPGVDIHRRAGLERHVTHLKDLPVVDPVFMLVDLATVVSPAALERAINEADKRDLIRPDVLRTALDHIPRRAGVAALRRLLDRDTFVLTDSELERCFVPLARRAGLGDPQTRARVNGYRVDFFWADLGLVVETDGLRYHRTPAQQARDRLRDHAHLAAGLTPVRFTYAQVTFEPWYVVETLKKLARRVR